jgi:hypothetical protein
MGRVNSLLFLAASAAFPFTLPHVASFPEERALTRLQSSVRAFLDIRSFMAQDPLDLVVLCPTVSGNGIEYYRNGVVTTEHTLSEYWATFIGTFGTKNAVQVDVGVLGWDTVRIKLKEYQGRVRAVWVIAHGYDNGDIACMDPSGENIAATSDLIVRTLLRTGKHEGARARLLRRAMLINHPVLPILSASPYAFASKVIPVIFGNCYGHLTVMAANRVVQHRHNLTLKKGEVMYKFFSVATASKPCPEYNAALKYPNGDIAACADMDTKRLYEELAGMTRAECIAHLESK